MKKLQKLSYPYYVWLLVLIVVPLLAMLFLSFFSSEGMNFEGATFTFDNFKRLLEKSVLVGLWNSVKFAGLATIICLLIGYPLAYIISRLKISNRFLFTLLLVIPMWSNILLRTNALAYFFSENNMITGLLAQIGIHFSIPIKGTGLAIVIGLVMVYLPFMILPVYTVLEKIDQSLYDASYDLGGDPVRTFFHVTVPISLKGVTTGIIMVFLPCFSGFAIPKILGSEKFVMIGTIIEDSFVYMDYNFGSLISLFLVATIIVSLMLIHKVDKEGETLL